ncbi:D-alanyl-D-alanine carboxypeptidase/D-alanyl-D-alanine-endopeptidase [Niabella ginsenosidivorans]|uniref:D-alanyl-D-alanine carboxypeptidase/D-alanyl-D-alanine-endopeptidase n=1 Tax=Niabella ginsenosidivorans TaxID=1176587 RepID=A0A1A9IBE2_9BACT|nr:D-alanyl-D-alanine carboxypeptidase/D-alanyl-D-alanine-endopeptidase [Niabella ginsenosidivorans]ANH84001.1 D-alanyl-D-alanine carboxypeptidase/D-alanyl-D-alanine-endopeptidase [Niabella ginsenosidivorans]
MRRLFCSLALLGCFLAQGQVSTRLSTAMEAFNADAQLSHALVSLYVINAKTGAVVFDQNSSMGMATASTEKIITAATAFDILGKDFKYETRFGIVNTPRGKSLYIDPSGDPTLASWRWDDTKAPVFLSKLKAAIQQTGVKELHSVIIYTGLWGDETIPDGWIWEDLGNYYGAGAQALNWRENQFDLILRSGAEGSPVSIVKTDPYLYDYAITSKATAGSKTSDDNTNLYYPSMGNKKGILTGTIPAEKKGFVISGSIYDPANQFVKTVISNLKGTVSFASDKITVTAKEEKNVNWFFTNASPDLSKIIYWFLRKSVNLYGEALLKTVGLKQKGQATTDNGIDAEKEYWKDKGVDPEELHLYDGSGLSPQNRITTKAQVTILKYAQQQPWFADYYEAFPVYNDMKMKSGTINRVKGFSGYQQSKDGDQYIFSMLVNNYSGSQYALIRKMYKVLDELK